MGLGFSVSGSAIKPQIHYTAGSPAIPWGRGRRAKEPSSTEQAPRVLASRAGATTR
jgi:hypothetical protein